MLILNEKTDDLRARGGEPEKKATTNSVPQAGQKIDAKWSGLAELSILQVAQKANFYGSILPIYKCAMF